MQMLTLAGGWALLSFLGMGLPLGIPPEKEEAIMAHIAPEECVLYATWTAAAPPSAASANQTEQLLAEPEVQAFAAAVQRNVMAAALAAAKKGGTPPEQAEKTSNAVSLWIRTLFTRSGALYLSKLAPRGSAMDVQGGALLKAGDASAELDRTLVEMLAAQGVTVGETTIASRTFHQVMLPGPEPLALVWGAGNGYLMVGLGAGALEEMSGRIRAQHEPAWLTQVKANLPVDRRASVSYVNLKKLMDTFLPLGGPEAERIANVWGLRQLTSFQTVTGLDRTGILSRTLVAIDGTPRGILALLDEKGIGAADWKHIPADAHVALGFTADLHKTYETVLSALAETDPRAADAAKAAVQQAAAQIGIDIPETLKAIGSRWSLHASPSDGGWLGAALTIEVRNKDRLLELERRLLTKLQGAGGEIPGVGNITRTAEGGHSVASLNLRGPAALVVPSWCVTDKQLIIGPNPQAVKSVLSRQPTEKSLADVPEVAALMAGERQPLAISYYDTPNMFAGTYASLQTFLPMINAMARDASIPFDLNVGQLPAQRTVAKHLRPSITVTRRTAKGLETESRQTFPMIGVGPSTGVAVALLLPAVQAAREAARRMQSGNHIKQQLLCMHNYHDVHGTLPPAYSVSKEGKPLLSWRVAILPFAEQKELYDQFHLDEPWDSEHNKQLIEKMPPLFRSPNSNAKAGMTNYLGVGGPRGALGKPIMPGAKGISFSAITDGTSNTVLIVEATDALAVEWTKPVEWVPDAKDPLKGLSGMRPGGFLAGFADGHTQIIAQSIMPEMLLSAFSRDDGKVIDWPEVPGGPARPGPAPRLDKALNPALPKARANP